MATSFKAHELSREDLPRIQPLLNLVWGASEAAPWILPDMDRSGAAHVAEVGAEDGIPEDATPPGALIVERPDGYVAGLLCYQVVVAPPWRTFDCPLVIVPDMVRSHHALTLMLDEAEQRARGHDCRRLRLALTFIDEPPANRRSHLTQTIRDRGFAYYSVLYSKEIDGAGHRAKQPATENPAGRYQ